MNFNTSHDGGQRAIIVVTVGTAERHHRVVTLTCGCDSQVVGCYPNMEVGQFDFLDQLLRELVTQVDIVQAQVGVAGQEAVAGGVSIVVVAVRQTRDIGSENCYRKR